MPLAILKVSALFEARVDSLLSQLEQETPAVQRLRRIPMDRIAIAVVQDQAHGLASNTDAGIQKCLRELLVRNYLGTMELFKSGDEISETPGYEKTAL